MEEKEVQRDFEGEVRAFYEARPELRGEEIPQQVLKECIGGKTLSDAYDTYADEQTQAQNKKAAAQAPVRSVTRGGSVEATPEDAFLRGFNAEW